MTKREAYRIGHEHGRQAAQACLVDPSDWKIAGCEHFGSGECEECIAVAAYDSESNARQYADHLAPNMTDAQQEAYEAGVAAGVAVGVKARLAQASL